MKNVAPYWQEVVLPFPECELEQGEDPVIACPPLRTLDDCDCWEECPALVVEGEDLIRLAKYWLVRACFGEVYFFASGWSCKNDHSEGRFLEILNALGEEAVAPAIQETDEYYENKYGGSWHAYKYDLQQNPNVRLIFPPASLDKIKEAFHEMLDTVPREPRDCWAPYQDAIFAALGNSEDPIPERYSQPNGCLLALPPSCAYREAIRIMREHLGYPEAQAMEKRTTRTAKDVFYQYAEMLGWDLPDIADILVAYHEKAILDNRLPVEEQVGFAEAVERVRDLVARHEQSGDPEMFFDEGEETFDNLLSFIEQVGLKEHLKDVLEDIRQRYTAGLRNYRDERNEVLQTLRGEQATKTEADEPIDRLKEGL